MLFSHVFLLSGSNHRSLFVYIVRNYENRHATTAATRTKLLSATKTCFCAPFSTQRWVDVDVATTAPHTAKQRQVAIVTATCTHSLARQTNWPSVCQPVSQVSSMCLLIRSYHLYVWMLAAIFLFVWLCVQIASQPFSLSVCLLVDCWRLFVLCCIFVFVLSVNISMKRRASTQHS